MLYPLKFTPILKEMLWGGKKIPSRLNIDVEEDVKIGENFVVSGLKNDTSIVSEKALAGENLTSLIQKYKGQLVGEKVYKSFGSAFPLLIKFIDANDDLSVQVHPNDTLAKVKHNSFGKTEMWYILESGDKSDLISGFSRKTSADEFLQMQKDKKIMELMQHQPTNGGDVFFIPAGRVHSIGKGNLIAEIQQTSDITYRIYDFDRKDKNGNSRQLHQELAMDAMNFSDNESGKIDYPHVSNSSSELVSCPYFTTNIIELDSIMSKHYSSIDSFVILMNVGGKATLESKDFSTELNEMEAILIPACVNNIKLCTNNKAKLLEIYI